MTSDVVVLADLRDKARAAYLAARERGDEDAAARYGAAFRRCNALLGFPHGETDGPI